MVLSDPQILATWYRDCAIFTMQNDNNSKYLSFFPNPAQPSI